MEGISGKYCIVGVGEAPCGSFPELSHWDFYLAAARAAIADAGVNKSAIDGVITSSSMVVHLRRHHVIFCEQMGIAQARFTALSAMGGSGPTSNLRHAVAMLNAGMATMVLVVGADNLLSGRGRQGAVVAGPAESHNAEFEIPYGPSMATLYALFVQRWMHEFGWTSEQLAAVPVAMRKHASLRPGAMHRSPLITKEDVLASRMISTPFRMLDCSVFSDGGGAYIVTTVERARALRKKPLYILGVGGAYSYYYFEKWPDLVDFPRNLMGSAASESFSMAGIERSDIDLAAVPDMFGATVPTVLESAGFCGRGEGAAFVQDGRIEHGGNHSFGLPGAGAQYIHFTEACLQLWGEAEERQVASARTAYLHNWSGNMSQHGCAILGNELP
jgi:acetyl-CoA acetyltransferase